MRRIPPLVACAVVFLFGCRDQVASPFEGHLDVLLYAPSLRLPVGTTHQFLVEITRRVDGTPSKQDVVWKSSNPNVAQVSPSGVVTALRAGSTTIEVAPKKASTTAVMQSATADIEVYVPVSAVSISPSSGQVPVDGVLQLTATAQDASGNSIPGETITWSSSVGSVATVSSTGLVTGLTAGATAITATTGNASGSMTLTVEPRVTAVTITPTPVQVVTGSMAQLTATARDEAGNPVSGRTFAWTSSNSGVAAVSSTGVVTAVSAGTATVSATTNDVTGNVAVTVVPAVASISVSPGGATIDVGGSAQLVATARDAAGAPVQRTVTWSSSNSSVASVNASGLVSGSSAGSATITARADGASASVVVNVNAASPTVSTVVLSPATAVVQTGATLQATATARDGSGNVISGATFSWNSAQTAIATVSSSGVITGVSAGTATITATTNGVTGSLSVTVVAPPPPPPPPPTVASVTLAPATGSVAVGATLQLTPTARDAAGNVLTGRTFTWSSTNQAVATVSAAGVVTGVAAGSATIRASADGVIGSSSITVTAAQPGPVTSVTVSPATVNTEVGNTVTLTATARDAAGNVVNGQTFTWLSSTPAVASVSSSGIVTAAQAGTTTISARVGTVSGTSAVTVTAGGGTGQNRVLFFSDWRTATGNSLTAVSDGGKWDFQSRSFDRTMNIIPSSGLDFPTPNVYEVKGVADMEGWSMLRKSGMAIPAVGESRYYRWYIRVTMPDGMSDYQTHPIQDGFASSQSNWMFIVINANNSGVSSVPAGRYEAQFWADAAPYPNQRWRGPVLNKNQTYRFEFRVLRATATQFSMQMRIYDSANNLIATESNFRTYDTNAQLTSSMLFPLKNAANLDGLNAGNNGIGGTDVPWPFTISYQAGFAVCVDTWCGPYNGNY